MDGAASVSLWIMLQICLFSRSELPSVLTPIWLSLPDDGHTWVVFFLWTHYKKKSTTDGWDRQRKEAGKHNKNHNNIFSSHFNNVLPFYFGSVSPTEHKKFIWPATFHSSFSNWSQNEREDSSIDVRKRKQAKRSGLKRDTVYNEYAQFLLGLFKILSSVPVKFPQLCSQFLINQLLKL